MREFKTRQKINFIDNNDVLVGFDNQGSCCENFGYFYSEKFPTFDEYKFDCGDVPDIQPPADLEEYFFDREFYRAIEDSSKFDGGGAAVFRLTNGGKELFLILYNSQNGYYSHGFEMGVPGKVIISGSV